MKSILSRYLLLSFISVLLINCSSDGSPEVTIVNAPTITGVEAFDSANNGDGRDLEVTFNKAGDESLVSEYRVFVVQTDEASSFNRSVAEGVDAGNYTSVQPNGANQVVTLTETSTDTGGEIIDEGIEYIAYVLSVVDGVNATGENALSSPTASLMLVDVDYDVYVSDAGNFQNPPWQILKFDVTGRNPSVFINTNLAWPQDILFLEQSNEVLISNFTSGRITKHNATTGDFIEDFATGLSGPTRIKIGQDGLLYVLQWNGTGIVLRYNLDGSFEDEFTSVGVTQSIGMDWDANGNFYVSSYNGDLVRRFDSNGNDLGVFINSNLAGPTNIWFDESGDLLVSDYDGTAVKRFDSSGNYEADFLRGLSNSEGIGLLPSGNILVGNGASNSVKMFSSDGTFIRDFIPSGSGNLIAPNAVVIRGNN